MRSVLQNIVVAIGGICVLSNAAGAGDSPLATSRELISQWTQTRQLISSTRSGWESDRETLQQTSALYERELKAVSEQISKVSTNSTVADRERVQAEAGLKEQTDAIEAAKKLAIEMEGHVRKTLPLLPSPLATILKPVLDRLPADSNNTKAGVTERIQTLVSFLNELDKFNNAVSVFPEKQQNPRGETVSVDTLYLGLGSAWFVDASGEFAGTGRPTSKGWEWKVEPGISQQVRDAIAIYRSQKPAAFVALPVIVQ